MLHGFHKQENFEELCSGQDVDLDEEVEFYQNINSLVNFDNSPNVRVLSRNA
jgi:hypothetical protein